MLVSNEEGPAPGWVLLTREMGGVKVQISWQMFNPLLPTQEQRPGPQGTDNFVIFIHIADDSSGQETQTHQEETLKTGNWNVLVIFGTDRVHLYRIKILTWCILLLKRRVFY